MIKLGSEGWMIENHWSPAIKDKIAAYIDSEYRPEYRKHARMNYAKPTRMNCLIFLEWHNHPECKLKFTEPELAEIRSFLAKN